MSKAAQKTLRENPAASLVIPMLSAMSKWRSSHGNPLGRGFTVHCWSQRLQRPSCQTLSGIALGSWRALRIPEVDVCEIDTNSLSTIEMSTIPPDQTSLQRQLPDNYFAKFWKHSLVWGCQFPFWSQKLSWMSFKAKGENPKRGGTFKLWVFANTESECTKWLCIAHASNFSSQMSNRINICPNLRWPGTSIRASDSRESPQTCDSQFLAPWSAIRKEEDSVREPSGWYDSRESGA